MNSYQQRRNGREKAAADRKEKGKAFCECGEDAEVMSGFARQIAEMAGKTKQIIDRNKVVSVKIK